MSIALGRRANRGLLGPGKDVLAALVAIECFCVSYAVWSNGSGSRVHFLGTIQIVFSALWETSGSLH
jgi:hypothetical protein